MKKGASIQALVFLILATGFKPALADAPNICAALLSQGIRDTESVQISESRFNEIKSNVCNSNYDSYSKASSQAAGGAFDLVGVFGISGSEANANSEYSTRWSNFCQSNYGEAMSDSNEKSYYSVANRQILNSFDHCIDVQAERFIRFVEPQADGKSFNIVFKNKREGDPTFTITALNLTNVVNGHRLSLKNDCDFNHDLPYNTKNNSLITNAVSIVCRKKPEDEIVVNGATSAGNIDPVKVPAVTVVPPQIQQRVAALEGEFENLNEVMSNLTKDQVEVGDFAIGEFGPANSPNPSKPVRVIFPRKFKDKSKMHIYIVRRDDIYVGASFSAGLKLEIFQNDYDVDHVTVQAIGWGGGSQPFAVQGVYIAVGEFAP